MVHCCEWMWKGRGQYVSNNMGRGGERCSPEGGDGGSELKARGTNAIYTLQFNAIYTLIQCNANWTVQFSAIDTMDQCNAIYTVQFNALPTDRHMKQIVQTQLRCKTERRPDFAVCSPLHTAPSFLLLIFRLNLDHILTSWHNDKIVIIVHISPLLWIFSHDQSNMNED